MGPSSFEHTNYVTGWWATDDNGLPATGLTPLTYFVDGIAPFSWLYYPVIMGNAQAALGMESDSREPISPTYPPTTPAGFTQFGQVMTAIGYGIGTIAAHETGHQLSVPLMDCNDPPNRHPACGEDYLYQTYSSGANHDWFYVPVNGIGPVRLHWSTRAQCAINYYLLTSRYATGDGKCQ